MTNEEFFIKFNFQKMMRMGIEDNDIEKISSALLIDKNFTAACINDLQKNVENSARKLVRQLDTLKNSKDVSICFVGDSLTSDRESFFNMIKAAFVKNKNIRFIDASRSGNFTVSLLLDLYQEVVYKKPDIVHILIGSNDIRRNKDVHMKNCTSPKEYKRNIEYILKVLKDNGIKTMISTPPPFYDERIKTYFEGTNWYYKQQDYAHYCNIVRKSAKKYADYFCDLEVAFRGKELSEMLSEDGLHMSIQGYEVMAEAIFPQIINALNTV